MSQSTATHPLRRRFKAAHWRDRTGGFEPTPLLVWETWGSPCREGGRRWGGGSTPKADHNFDDVTSHRHTVYNVDGFS